MNEDQLQVGGVMTVCVCTHVAHVPKHARCPVISCDCSKFEALPPTDMGFMSLPQEIHDAAASDASRDITTDPIGTARLLDGHVFVKLAEPAVEPWHLVYAQGPQRYSGWQSDADMAGAERVGYLPIRECMSESSQAAGVCASCGRRVMLSGVEPGVSKPVPHYDGWADGRPYDCPGINRPSRLIQGGSYPDGGADG